MACATLERGSDTVILTSDDEWGPSKCNDLISVRDRLKNMTETVTTYNDLEYTTAGDIILTQSGTIKDPKPRHLSRTTPWKRRDRKLRRILEDPFSWNNSDDATYDVVSCDIKPYVDACDIEGAPVHQDEEIPMEDTQTPTTLWDLAFGSDDHPNETNLDNAIAENFSPAGREELQHFVNGEIFGDALSYIDKTHDISPSGNCEWNLQAAQAQVFETGAKDYGGGPDNFNDPSPVEHEFWCNDTFMCSDLAARFVYQGILEHCSRYDISTSKVQNTVHFGPRVRKPSKIDYEAMQPHFCYLLIDTIRLTFENTSQNMPFSPSSHLQKYHCSCNPAANVHCRNEDDAMDQIFSDTLAVDGEETSAYFFIGFESHLAASVHKTK